MQIDVDFHCAVPDIDAAPLEVRLAIFRFVQEALTNVAKHARAGLVSVVIERIDRTLHVNVEDDGRGFDPREVEPTGNAGLGLLGMRERIALLGGEAKIQSSPGGGTTVFRPASPGAARGKRDDRVRTRPARR